MRVFLFINYFINKSDVINERKTFLVDLFIYSAPSPVERTAKDLRSQPKSFFLDDAKKVRIHKLPSESIHSQQILSQLLTDDCHL